MKYRVIALSLLMAMSAGTFAAHHEEGEAADKAKSVREDKNAKVCKRLEVPGSHIKKRVCKTKRYWDKLTKDSQELAQEMSD